MLAHRPDIGPTSIGLWPHRPVRRLAGSQARRLAGSRAEGLSLPGPARSLIVHHGSLYVQSRTPAVTRVTCILSPRTCAGSSMTKEVYGFASDKGARGLASSHDAVRVRRGNHRAPSHGCHVPVGDTPTPAARWVDAMRRLDTIDELSRAQDLALRQDCGTPAAVDLDGTLLHRTAPSLTVRSLPTSECSPPPRPSSRAWLRDSSANAWSSCSGSPR